MSRVKMKAWRFSEFGGPERMKLEEIAIPQRGNGEALIRIRAAGVNPVDRSTVSGRFDWIGMPHVPGAEFVGVIEEIDENREGLKSGEAVAVNPKIFCGKCYYCMRGEESACLENRRMERAPLIIGIEGDGGWRELASVPVKNLMKIGSMAMVEACTLPVDGATAMHLSERAELKLDEFALVMGATGGVGMFLVQLARLRGCEVAAVVGSDDAGSAVLEFGADHAINRTKVDIPSEVKKLTGGRGADVVFDPLGSATWKTSIASLAPMGRYATCGILTGGTAELSLLTLYSMQHKIIGSTTFSRKDLAAVIELMGRGKIRAPVDSVYPFERLPDAMKRLDEHGRSGKVMLSISNH